MIVVFVFFSFWGIIVGFGFRSCCWSLLWGIKCKRKKYEEERWRITVQFEALGELFDQDELNYKAAYRSVLCSKT